MKTTLATLAVLSSVQAADEWIDSVPATLQYVAKYPATTVADDQAKVTWVQSLANDTRSLVGSLTISSDK